MFSQQSRCLLGYEGRPLRVLAFILLQGQSREVACLAEAAVGCCRTYGPCSRGAKSGARSDDDAATLVSNRVREELEAVTAADLLQVVLWRPPRRVLL